MSSDLQNDQYNDLKTYHTALKQFLNVSNAPSKPNPKRAAKAREKLLKLSATQFYELSTDVYDELERRIDESRDEPDFLLPKPSFHPKRNEAREKLGSLQQGRFRDLVSDIFYEIERREYHKVQVVETYEEKRQSLTGSVQDQYNQGKEEYHQQQQQQIDEIQDHHNLKEINQDRVSDPSSKNGVVGLQSTTVIPTKADLAWSSDEEDDNVSELRKSPDQKRGALHSRNHSRNQSRELNQELDYNNNSNRNSNHSHQSNVSDVNDLSSPQKKNINRGLSLSKGRNKDREIEMLLEEGTKMDQTITQLEQKLTLLQSKSDKFENEANDLKQINQNLNIKISDLQSELKSNSNNNDTTSNSRSLQPAQSVERSIGESSSIDQETLDDLKKEVINWRSKFEDLKLQKIEDVLSINKLAETHTSKHLVNNGSIPINLVNFLYQAVESFLLFLNKGTKFDSKIDVNALFDHISKISSVSGKITSFAPHSEKADLVRASISHAITSTRYYALYSEFLPKLIVESSVSEIVFTICDLIADVKLNKDDSKFDASEFNQIIGNDQSGSKSKSLEDEDPSEISPVRPLRMAKKAIENNNTSNNNTPGSNRTVDSTSNTPRSLNLTINPQNANNEYKKSHPQEFSNKNLVTPSPSASQSKLGSKSEGLNDSFDSPSTTRNFKLADKSNRISGSDNNSNKNLPPSSTSSNTTPLRKNGLPSLVSRYSPESERKPQDSTTPPKPHLRKSSSSNILSKVRQFEQQSNSDSESRNSPQRSVVSPFNDSSIGKLSPKRTSVESQNNNKINASLEKKELPQGDKSIDAKPLDKSSESQDLAISANPQSEDKSISNEKKGSSVMDTVKSSLPGAIPTALASVIPASLTSNKSSGKDSNEDKAKDVANNDRSLEPSKATNDNVNVNLNGNGNGNNDQNLDEESDDLNSVAQLRGAIAKDKQLSPQNEKISLNPQVASVDSNTKTIPQSNEVIEDAEEDLNEVPYDDEDNVDEKPLNVSKTRQTQPSNNTYQKHSIKEASVDSYNGVQTNSSSPINNDVYNKTSANSKSLNNGDNESEFTSAQTNSDIIAPKQNVISEPIVDEGDEKFEDSRDYSDRDDDEVRDEEEEAEEDDQDQEQKQGQANGNTRRGRDLDEDFDVRDFDIEDPDNTLSELLLYLEHQTVKVISTIQTLLTSIKAADSTKGELRSGSRAINAVVSQMIDATSNSMNQSRNASLKEHGIWVVQSLEDSGRRMDILCNSSSKDGEESEDDNEEYAEKHFKQRLAGIAFDVAKCTKELVKTVEEANLREEIEHLDAKMNR